MPESPQDRFTVFLVRYGTYLGTGLGVILISTIRVAVLAVIAYPVALVAAFYAKSLPRDESVWSLAAVWSLWAAMYHLGKYWSKNWPKYRETLRERAGR